MLVLVLPHLQAAAAAADVGVTVDDAVVKDEFAAAEIGGWPSAYALHCCEDRTADWHQTLTRNSSFGPHWELPGQLPVSGAGVPPSMHHLELPQGNKHQKVSKNIYSFFFFFGR